MLCVFYHDQKKKEINQAIDTWNHVDESQIMHNERRQSEKATSDVILSIRYAGKGGNIETETRQAVSRSWGCRRGWLERSRGDLGG